ncbi:S-adenosyl-L-methionine-dependent methyltransferase [Boletus edulis BED1]|uniref:Arsenite methyltransferase n=1 Tax=Boletus edulis BED1 TaxID=1328754 RepID=A0AAD4G8V7_BOLED|nr:S-adenosyl-L-methionine-dependent methyltransferase [Boletus edulis BED1]
MSNRVSPDDDAALINVVNEAYSQKARVEGTDRDRSNRVANAFGYTPEQLQSVSAEAHMGLSCGNPVAAASIKEGETVLDLGSGGGIDVFLAAAKVGPSGQAIGLDNSDDMIARARRIATTKGLKPPNVAFVKATLTEELPIESNSVDCVLSNCVINLLPPAGKLKVMQEVHRILKPGGRVSLDDIVAKKPFPESLRSNVALYVSCISGAILLQEYQALVEDAGFKDILFMENPSDLNVYLDSGSTGCCSRANSAISIPTDIGDLNEMAKSYHIYATKANSSAATNSAPASALKNWWDAYPVPASSASSLECAEVADLIKNPGFEKKDFVVVDVRRNDHAGGHVRGSIQQPAQTFYDDLPMFYEQHKETKQVIFYCGSSRGRGPRCAKWYQDYLDQQRNTESKAFWMTGGAKEWVASYKGRGELVDFD